jgi:GWxTD domain-containing protein
MTNLQIAIAWTVIHSIWQAGLAALAVACVISAVRTSSMRYVIACAAFLGIVAGAGATFVYEFPRNPARVQFHSLAPAGLIPESPVSFEPVRTAKRFTMQDALPWITPLWLIGFAAFNLKHVASWFATRRMRTRGVCLAPEGWQERIKRAGARLGVSRPVVLLESCLVKVPVVTGQMRPMILVPIGLMTGLPVEQIELILLHELAHIRRHDYFVNMLQTFVEGMMFYNPAVWWISNVIRKEREHCCDDIVVAATQNAHAYAGALAALEEARGTHGELAIASTGGSLVKRINRLLRPPDVRGYSVMPLASSIVLIAIAAVVLAARPVPRTTRVETAAPAGIPAVAAVQQPSAAVPVRQKAALAGQTPAPALLPPELLKRWIDQDVGFVITPEQRESWKAQRWLGQDVALLTQPVGAPQSSDALMRWLNEDVVYIITDDERKAFLELRTDQERGQFIDQFWLRRDPTPGTVENEYKDEHYARIAWANEHFTTKAGVPGWKTDRGRISIRYGKPDELESQPAGSYTRPGGGTLTFPFELWLYKYIEGIGSNILLEFVDTTSSGDFRLTVDPTAPKRIGSVEGKDKPRHSYAELFALGLVRYQVTVTGEVNHPNVFFVLRSGKSITLTQLLALANGLTKDAGDVAQIKHAVTSDQLPNRIFVVNFRQILRGESPDVPLSAGDEVFIPSRQIGWTPPTQSPVLMDTKPTAPLRR